VPVLPDGAGPASVTERSTRGTGVITSFNWDTGSNLADTGRAQRVPLYTKAWLSAGRRELAGQPGVLACLPQVCTEAGVGDGWTPRELRTTFVSLMSHHGIPVEEIARLAGHASTRTTEVVYRRELRPVITTGAEIMDEIFPAS
jgi:integrase